MVYARVNHIASEDTVHQSVSFATNLRKTNLHQSPNSRLTREKSRTSQVQTEPPRAPEKSLEYGTVHSFQAIIPRVIKKMLNHWLWTSAPSTAQHGQRWQRLGGFCLPVSLFFGKISFCGHRR